MEFMTSKKLQADFGLPFARAELIIDEQMRLARKRYAWLMWLCWSCMLSTIVVSFLGGSVARHVVYGLIVAGSVLVVISESLTRRIAYEPILAAARAWQANMSNNQPGR